MSSARERPRDDEEPSGVSGPATDGPQVADDPAGAPMTQKLGRLVVLALAVVFVVFALDNAQHVDFSWVIGGTDVAEQGGSRAAGGVRLIVLLVASFVIGAAVGATVVAGRARARRKAARDGG